MQTNYPVVHFYTNTFEAKMQPLDCEVVFMHDSQPGVMLSMSHAMAKTLVMSMLAMLQAWEKKTDTMILTQEMVQRFLAE
jgi:hypothetical protein